MKLPLVLLLVLITPSLATGQSRKFVMSSPDRRFDAICDFSEAPPFKIVERASGKSLLAMDDERVGNHGLSASWSPDSNTLVVLVEWRLGVQLQVCRFTNGQFERTEGPSPPEDFLTLGQWDGSTKLQLKGEKGSYALKVGPTGTSFDSAEAPSPANESAASLVGTWTRHADTTQYRADGTYNVIPRYSAPRHGKWQFDGRSITHIEHGKTWSNRIVSLTPTELKMKFPDGTDGLDYERVDSSTGELPTAQPSTQPDLTNPSQRRADREAIMDVMRLDFYSGDSMKVHRNARRILFNVRYISVKHDWALVCVLPVNAAGKTIAELRWALLRRSNGRWSNVDYFNAIRPYPSEEAAQDALDMNASTIRKIWAAFPDAPRYIFPEPSQRRP